VSTTIKLRWKPLRSSEWKAIIEKKRTVFKSSKGIKKVPVRGADIEGHYYLDIYTDGNRSYEFIGLKTGNDGIANDETERMAKQVAAHWQDETWRVSHGFGTKIKGAIPFVDFFRTLSQGRHKTWRSVLLILENFPNAQKPLNLIDVEWLHQFQEVLLQSVSQNTASTYYAKIKAAFTIAIEHELISSNPSARVRSIKPQPSQRTYLRREELQILANTKCIDSETKRAFLFASYTGLRLSDVRRLTWDEYRNGKIEFKQKKTGQPEYLDLSPVAVKLIKNGIEDSNHDGEDRIFSLPPDGTLWTYLQSWAIGAGLTKHISFHVARHTFACMMLETTKDLFLVSKLLGHTDIKHTQVYAKIVDERKRDAMMSLPQIELE
jgi:integrase